MDFKGWISTRLSERNTRRSLVYFGLLAGWVGFAAWDDPASLLDPVKLGTISAALAGIADGILTPPAASGA